MQTYHPFTLFPLGDHALVVDFGNQISEELNKKVLHLFHQLRRKNLDSITDLVPAYSSLTIHYDLYALRQHPTEKTAFDQMAEMIEAIRPEEQTDADEERLIRIPVCYERRYASDLELLARHKQLSKEEVIHLHTGNTYRVFMIGFLPGFPYMGSVDERISMERRKEPRSSVAAGSVGIAGRQTGIYPLNSPGGWNIIGRTPVPLFRKEGEPVYLHPGDQVSFYSITEDEFRDYQCRHS